MAIKLEQFEVKTWSQSGQQYDQMYANGRQQCQVEIDILKLVYNEDTQDWDQKQLSSSEEASLKLVTWSDKIDSELPEGWSCDPNRNAYDIGLPTQTTLVSPLPTVKSTDLPRQVKSTCKVAESSTIKPVADNQPQVIMRYITANKTGTQKLMARIQLDDGSVITTNMNLEYGSFESYVMVTSITVVPMKADDLTVSRDDVSLSAARKGDPQVDVDVYYYKLPNNLTVLDLTSSYDIGNYAYFYHKGYHPFLTDPNITYGRVYPVGTSSGTAAGSGCHEQKTFSIDPSPSHFVAMRGNEDECKWQDNPPSGTANVTIIDNYGSEHRFVLYPQEDGNKIAIRDPY